VFKKKPFVRFVNLLPGVLESHPIEKAGEVKYNWLTSMAKDFKQREKVTPANEVTGSGSRCPGITEYVKQGYIVTAPMDFTVTTTNNPDEQPKVDWYGPRNTPGQAYVSFHSPPQLTNFMPVREGTSKWVLKVNTYWRYNCSDDVLLLQLPIGYNDNPEFTASHGLLDPRWGCEINVQIFWHKLGGTTLIEAGTPLMQLIPIPRDYAVNMMLDQPNEKDLYINQAWAYANTRKFKRNMKEFYEVAKRVLKR